MTRGREIRSQRSAIGEGMCCHLERERGERVRAFEGVASGGGNSDLWARVDTIVLGQACDANAWEGAGR